MASMNIDSPENEQSFNLPPPESSDNSNLLMPEQSGVNASGEIAQSAAIEKGITTQAPVIDPASLGAALPGLASTNAAVGSSGPGSASTSSLIADDGDLIEKAWIEKAKEIVERTRLDPHIQNKEINRVKADYLKKRYNKDLKLAED